MRISLGCISIDIDSGTIEVNHSCALKEIHHTANWWLDNNTLPMMDTIFWNYPFYCRVHCPCGCGYTELDLEPEWKLNTRSLSLITNPIGKITCRERIIWERKKNQNV